MRRAGSATGGFAGALTWDPHPESGRGVSLALRQTVGASSTGGMDALLGRDTLAGLAANDNGDELQRRRLEMKLGYGLSAFGDRFTFTPELGVGLSDGGRDYNLGWRLNLGPGGSDGAGAEAGGDPARARQPRIGVRGRQQRARARYRIPADGPLVRSGAAMARGAGGY